MTISVRLNHAQRENNRSSFGKFSGPNLMLKMTSRRGPDLARGPDFADPWFSLMSIVWTAKIKQKVSYTTKTKEVTSERQIFLS